MIRKAVCIALFGVFIWGSAFSALAQTLGPKTAQELDLLKYMVANSKGRLIKAGIMMDATQNIGLVVTLVMPANLTEMESLNNLRKVHELDAEVLRLAGILKEKGVTEVSFQVEAVQPSGQIVAACTYISWLDEMRCSDQRGDF